MDDGAGRGTDKAEEARVLQEGRDRIETAGRVLRQVLDHQGERDLKGIDTGPTGDLQTERLEDLGDDQDGVDLLLDHDRLPAPEQMQSEMRLDQIDRQLEVPPPGIELGDLADRELLRIADIGDVAVGRGLVAEGHQTDGMLGPIGPIGTEFNDAVEGVAPLVVGVDDPIAGLLPQPTNPVIAGVGQVVEPGKAEVAQIGQEEAAHGEVREEIAGMTLLIGSGILLIENLTPLLTAEVKEAGEGATQEAGILRRESM